MHCRHGQWKYEGIRLMKLIHHTLKDISEQNKTDRHRRLRQPERQLHLGNRQKERKSKHYDSGDCGKDFSVHLKFRGKPQQQLRNDTGTEQAGQKPQHRI